MQWVVRMEVEVGPTTIVPTMRCPACDRTVSDQEGAIGLAVVSPVVVAFHEHDECRAVLGVLGPTGAL